MVEQLKKGGMAYMIKFKKAKIFILVGAVIFTCTFRSKASEVIMESTMEEVTTTVTDTVTEESTELPETSETEGTSEEAVDTETITSENTTTGTEAQNEELQVMALEDETEDTSATTEIQEGMSEVVQPVISVVLPGDVSFMIDQYNIETTDTEYQITSPVYEIVNLSEVDVKVGVTSSITSSGFEFMTAKSEQDLVSSDSAGKKALYMAMRIADAGTDTDVLEGNYAFNSSTADCVMSKETPDSVSLLLEQADADGNAVSNGKTAFKFIGNVDPHREYTDGELKVQTVFSLEILTKEQYTEMKENLQSDKQNMLVVE